jgi:hypothetical protein
VRDIEVTDEQCQAAATEALTRPSNFGTSDDRLYRTHGIVMTKADNADDITAESNYAAALRMLEAAVAHDETGASEARGDDVCDLGMSHWGFGPCSELFVRVWADDTRTTFTPAWREAVRISLALANYPILDEDDHGEREHVAWEAVMDDALDTAARDHVDSEPERTLFYWLVTAVEPYQDYLYQCGFPDPDWDQVAELYAEVRADHFEWLAQRHLPHTRGADIPWLPQPGQEPIPGLVLAQ